MSKASESRWKYVWPWLVMGAVIGLMMAFAWD